AVMQPITREWLAAMRAGALRNLVFVMREDQIEPAAVNVECLPEMRLAHRRALDMPTGAAAAPRRLPAGQVGRRRLPQHEIAGILLVGRDFDPGAGDHFVPRAAGEFAVLGIARDAEQDMAFGAI